MLCLDAVLLLLPFTFFFSSVQFVVGLSLVNRWRTSETPRGSLFHKLACIKKMKMWCSTISVSISVYFFQHIYSVTCFYRHSTYKKILNFYHPSILLFWSIQKHISTYLVLCLIAGELRRPTLLQKQPIFVLLELRLLSHGELKLFTFPRFWFLKFNNLQHL